MDTLFVVWRCANVVLASAGLLLLLDDVRVRRQLRVRQRFYWQAVALMLVSLGWGTAVAVLESTPLSPVRTAVISLALVYFLVSIVHVRRFNRREEEEMFYRSSKKQI